MKRRVAQLAGVVRRDIGRHADRDAGGAVRQQIGKGGREHRRLLLAPVVIGAEIDRVLVDAIEEMRGARRQPRLGVAGGGGLSPSILPKLP